MFGIWQYWLLGYSTCIHSIHHMKWDTGVKSHCLLICPNQTPISTECPKLSLNVTGQWKCEGGSQVKYLLFWLPSQIGRQLFIKDKPYTNKMDYYYFTPKSSGQPERNLNCTFRDKGNQIGKDQSLLLVSCKLNGLKIISVHKRPRASNADALAIPVPQLGSGEIRVGTYL